MKIFKEFKEFAVRGSVIDLAVGLIVGGAFGKFISSLVNDVLMPPLGLLIGGINFRDFKFILKSEVSDNAGKIITQAVTLNYGLFIQSIIDFVIIAFSIFILVKAINQFKRKEEEKPVEATEDIKLLTEIRDLLKK